MDVNIPTEDFESIFKHIHDGVRDSSDFMNNIISKSKKCTQKAFDNVPFMFFSHVLYVEIYEILKMIKNFEHYSTVDFSFINFYPVVYCHQFDDSIEIKSFIDLKLYMVHVIYHVVLEYLDSMKIMYADNYDYQHLFTAEFLESMSDEKFARNIVDIISFMEYEFNGFDGVSFHDLIECIEKQKKPKKDIYLVFTKISNIINTVQNLNSYLMDILMKIRYFPQNNSVSVMLSRLQIEDVIEDAS